MAPKLYMTEASPPVRSILLAAEAIGLELEKVNVDLQHQEHLKPEFLKLNPQHTVPTFEDEDGFIICDSHAILSYIVEKYANDHPLYPKDLKKRATIHHRLHFDTASQATRKVAFGNIMKQAQLSPEKPEIPQEAIAALEATYDTLEKLLDQHKFVAGEEATIADLSLVTNILCSKVIVKIDSEKYPKVAAWLEEIEKLPYYPVNVDGNLQLEAFLKHILKLE